ncbi:hypothetical protein WDJ51_08995 [Rathayibacter sp. YIM 133350]|uniref:hypothetical protein n=1 Tax=Rathayibacter sp. YIM 133350 TaxID=3131992 RepID=UPI00307E7DD3
MSASLPEPAQSERVARLSRRVVLKSAAWATPAVLVAAAAPAAAASAVTALTFSPAPAMTRAASTLSITGTVRNASAAKDAATVVLVTLPTASLGTITTGGAGPTSVSVSGANTVLTFAGPTVVRNSAAAFTLSVPAKSATDAVAGWVQLVSNGASVPAPQAVSVAAVVAAVPVLEMTTPSLSRVGSSLTLAGSLTARAAEVRGVSISATFAKNDLASKQAAPAGWTLGTKTSGSQTTLTWTRAGSLPAASSEAFSFPITAASTGSITASVTAAASNAAAVGPVQVTVGAVVVPLAGSLVVALAEVTRGINIFDPHYTVGDITVKNGLTPTSTKIDTLDVVVTSTWTTATTPLASSPSPALTAGAGTGWSIVSSSSTASSLVVRLRWTGTPVASGSSLPAVGLRLDAVWGRFADVLTSVATATFRTVTGTSKPASSS